MTRFARPEWWKRLRRATVVLASALLWPAFAVAQPTITTPSITTVARQQFSAPVTFNLAGTNFNTAGNTTVIFNGSPQATTVTSPTALSFRLGWDDLDTAGSFQVVVRNVAPAAVTGDSTAINLTVNNPVVPTVTVTNPVSGSITAGGVQFALTVTGTGFVRDTVLQWNGQPRVTQVFSSTSAQMQVLASDIATAGAATISAFTPAPGGGTSTGLNFTVAAAPPPASPTITVLSPNTAIVNGASFNLTVNGTNFVPGSVVKWQGSARSTVYNGSTQVSAFIPASDLAAAAGPVNVTVENPGVAASPASTFTLTALATPTVTSVAPNSAIARGGPTTLTVGGTNFTINSVVRWNGAPRQTNFVGANTLSATLPATDVAAATTAAVSVFTPGAPTEVSNSLAFPVIDPPAPVITQFNPAALTIDTTTTFNVIGVAFTNDSVVRWNGVDRPTTVQGVGQLQVRLLPSDVANLGTAQVTVFTPAPGGGTSAAAPIEVIPFTRPTLSRISPNLVPPGSNGVTVQLQSDASNFRVDSRVRVGGAERSTTFQASNLLTVFLPASDLTAAGTLSITVFSPSANAESLPVVLTVGNALTPVITTLQCGNACAQITARGDTFALNVNGRNYTTQSVVQVNGITRPTVFNSESQLVATLALADTAAAGLLTVKVVTPTAPSESNVITVPIVNPGAPTLSQVNPSNVPVGTTTTLTLTVNGTGFVRDSVVEWNGVALPTTFVGSFTLQARVSPNDLQTAGTVLVRVTTPAPGGGVSANVSFSIDAPRTPAITSLNPAQVVAGGAPFSLQVTGTNFTAASVVSVNGTARPTTFNGSSSLSAQLAAGDIASAGSANVTVATAGAPGASNTVALAIASAGTPTITLLSPESFAAGTPGAPLTVRGSNFSSFSVVRFNGNARRTSFSSSTQLLVDLLPSDLASEGTGTITVANGSLVSAGVALAIGNPTTPRITQLSPAFTIAGGNGLELLVDGPGSGLPGAFSPASVINLDGAPLPTTYVSGTRLRTFIPASAVATAGTAQVTVTTPAPGGGVSSPLTFLINNPTGPIITALSPVSATVGTPQLTLTVVGQNFVAGRSTITWNGTPLPTDWQSGTQLQAQIPAAEIASASTAQVAVVTSGPGGGTSISVPFEIVAPNAPDITSLSQAAAPAGSGTLTLTVNGNSFTTQSVVNWNGSPRSTVYQNGPLLAVIPASDLATAGVATITVSTPGAPTSDSVIFIVQNTNGPILTRLSPSRVLAGGFMSTVQAIGSFDCAGITGALVNGVLRQGSCNAGTVFVPLTRSDIASAGTVTIAVQTTTQSGAQASIALPLAVVNPPAPVLMSVNPAIYRNRQAAQTINVNGANFVRGTVLHWNGAPRNTSVSGESNLSAQVSAADLAAAGTATITLVTPAPGGGTSNALVVEIEDPRVPTITSANNPSVVKTGDPVTPVSIFGSGYAPNSVAFWNGSPLETIFTTQTSLSARVPARYLRSATTALLTVNTPAPGGGMSAPFLIDVVENTSTIRITDISPDSIPRGSSTTTITVTGERFLPTSVVELFFENWQPLATTFVSATRLTAVVPARFVRDGGLYSVRVDSSSSRSWRVHDAFYFGEGSSGSFFDTEFALTNPSTTGKLDVTMTFAKGDGTTVQRTYTLAPQVTRRVLVDAIPGMESAPFSTLVETRSTTNSGLLVQRDMRWGSPEYGRHNVAGLRTSTDWYFGEGVDDANFDTFLLLGNFGPTAATATITAVRPSGGPLTSTVAVPANSRVTVNLGDIAGLENRAFGFTVIADLPVVAERAVYRTGPRTFELGSVSGGVERPSNFWVLPEGAAGPSFDSYHTIANFGTAPVDVRITILADTGQSFTRTLTVPAQSRETFAADADPELANLGGFAAQIEALNGEVVAELAQYLVSGGAYVEAHGGPGLVPTFTDGFGVGTFPATWRGIGYFGGANAEETYVLVANPNSSATTARLSCVSETGLPLGFSDIAIEASARATIRAADACAGLTGAPGVFSYTVQTLDSLGIVAGTSTFSTATGQQTFSSGTFTPGIR